MGETEMTYKTKNWKRKIKIVGIKKIHCIKLNAASCILAKSPPIHSQHKAGYDNSYRYQ